MKRYLVGPHWLDKEIVVSEEIMRNGLNVYE